MSYNPKKQMTMQIGKQGISDNFILTLQNAFKTHNTIRLAALKASGRDSDSINKVADSIVARLKGSFDYRIIGFTIIMRKKSNTTLRNEKLNKQSQDSQK